MYRPITVLVLCAASSIGYGAELTDAALAKLATRLDKLIRVTETPHEMADSTIAACAPAGGATKHQLHEGVQKSAFCNVYVTSDAKDVILSGRGRYPVGSLVVKSKLATKESKLPTLYTVMRKMDAGYDTKNGDWEYSILDGRTGRVQARGRIDSCISCHASYAGTDFVSRHYLWRRGG